MDPVMAVWTDLDRGTHGRAHFHPFYSASSSPHRQSVSCLLPESLFITISAPLRTISYKWSCKPVLHLIFFHDVLVSSCCYIMANLVLKTAPIIFCVLWRPKIPNGSPWVKTKLLPCLMQLLDVPVFLVSGPLQTQQCNILRSLSAADPSFSLL